MDVCNHMDCFSNSGNCEVGSTNSNLYQCYVKLHTDYIPQCKIQGTTGLYVMVAFVLFAGLSCCCGSCYYYRCRKPVTNNTALPAVNNNAPFNTDTANPISSNMQVNHIK